MPSYRTSDLPRYIPLSGYESVVAEMAARLSVRPEVVAIYGIGGFSSPGISDVDLVAVFKDGADFLEDPRHGAPVPAQRLLIHSLYGASRSFFVEAQQHSFFSPYRRLAGEDVLKDLAAPTVSAEIRRQTAFEYMVRLYISMALQRSYRFLRVRSVLLNANGAASDMECVSPGNTAAATFMADLKALRAGWFNSDAPPVKDFIQWFEAFFDWFGHFLDVQLKEHSFFLPGDRTYSLGKNLSIRCGDKLFPSE